jgi:AraC-like DNA-binding protein
MGMKRTEGVKTPVYIEKVEFPLGIPISYEGWQLGSYHLHAHRNVIEILMVAKGKANVTMSFERFELNQGDFIVIRESDSHAFSSSDSNCEIISLYFDMSAYVEKIPYLHYILFACESFDLAKYRNETTKIRNLILAILMRLIRGDDKSLDEAASTGEDLVWILANDYDMIKYYNRKWDASYGKIEKYYTIMGYLFENYSTKNPLEIIANEVHYSKSYISHLFKDVGASSLKDMLGFIRIYHSEEMLINTDLSIHDISDRCGFSDIKYFNSNFKKWFLCTPSEYRKQAVHEMNKASVFHALSPAQILKQANELTSCDLEAPQYKAAITPLSLKLANGGIGEQAEMKKSQPLSEETLAKQKLVPGARRHGLRVLLDEEMLLLSNEELAEKLKSYENMSFQPAITLDRRFLSAGKCKDLLLKAMGALGDDQDYQIIIMYADLGQHNEINKLMEEIGQKYQHKEIQPFFVG